VSVGMDGATHQALEEISLMAVLPNMRLVVPCDAVETKRLSQIAIVEVRTALCTSASGARPRRQS
jgi:transketolase C-terminal domain/subunit